MDELVVKTIVGYARVSTKGQAEEGYSIDAQKQSIEEYAEKNSYKLLKIFVDEGKSATTASRPMFKEMVNYCIENKVFGVVVWHTDRFARNELVHSLIKKELLENGVELLSITQPMIDTSPEGYLLDGVLANLNAYYSRDLGRKTKKGLVRKWESGWYPGPAVLGYKNVPNPNDTNRNIIVPDKIIAPLIVEMFQLYSTSKFSIQQLIEVFDKKGLKGKKGKELSHSTIHQILDNEFYYGRMNWSGLTKIGNHKPLITKSLFETCRYIRSKHRQFAIRRRKHNFLLCSFIYCSHCGRRYTAEWHRIKRSKLRDRIAYYHCTRPGGCYSKYAEKEDLEHKITNLFRKIEFTDDFINFIQEKILETIDIRSKDSKTERRVLINQLKALEKQRDDIEKKYCKNLINNEVYTRQHSLVVSEIDGISRRMADVISNRQLDSNLLEEVLNMTRNIYQTYKNSPDFMKQLYLRFFFERIEIKHKKVSKYIPTPTFKALLEGHKVLKLSPLLLG